jgi:hypothetical protein
VPTWCSLRQQFHFNGHHRLATALDKAGLEYAFVDNALVAIESSLSFGWGKADRQRYGESTPDGGQATC